MTALDEERLSILVTSELHTLIRLETQALIKDAMPEVAAIVSTEGY